LHTELRLHAEKLWSELLGFPAWPATEEIPFNPKGASPFWIPGGHPALKYRGSVLKRDKIWCQSGDYAAGLLKYGYTGWQHGISYATCALEFVPPIHRLAERLNA